MIQADTWRTRPHLLTAAGAGVFVLAYAWLLLTGNTEISASADPGAAKLSLWGAAVPTLAAMLLARLVPPKATVPLPLTELPRRRLVKETWVLVAAALTFALTSGVARDAGLLYILAKVVLLLIVPLIAFRLLRGGGPAAKAVPRPVTWLAPLPAVLAWFLLSEVGPLATPLTANLPDPVTLAVGSLITLLTAGVLEEVFYRGWLQTRIEALYGRWPAILASALLFALMHLSHVDPETPVLGLASIVAFQGVFGLMQGYLWSRYRNIWAIILIHVIVNLIYVDMLLALL